MEKKAASVRLVIIPKGPIIPMVQRNFDLKYCRLKTLSDIWKKQKVDFEIQVYIDEVLYEDAIIGASNKERLRNLKVYLQAFWEKRPISLKSERLFWLDLR